MKPIKKTVYTLCINNYAPEITEITFPLMRAYADKIGADFYVIEDRKFPDQDIPCEKFQIYELGKEHENDWNIFFDADTLIHPDFFDVTTIIGKDTTVSNGTDFLPHRFKPNQYHLRDGRMIGKGNWCAIASDWCLDYWHPPEGNWLDIAKDITPTVDEKNFGITPQHLIDDYIVSLNISRFGLKHKLIPQLTEERGAMPNMLYHQYLYDIDEKVINFNKVLTEWRL